MKGIERERNLSKTVYYSDGYFSLPQLCSFAHQLHDIHNLRPKNIIEIGIGNGFTSTFLKLAGYDVVTVDINSSLNPDLCFPISELETRVEKNSFDLVVCCEVLEHMPFDEFRDSVRIFRLIGRRLYMTLPSSKRALGFGGFLHLPGLRSVAINRYVEMNLKKHVPQEHYWEVGSSPETEKKNLVKILEEYFKNIRIGRYFLHPYHLSFFTS